MKSIHSDDLEFLRKIRGRFQNSKSQRQGEWLIIFLFAVFFPLFWLFFFFMRLPVILDKNHLIILALALGTFIAGIYLWKMRAVEYEFTGDEIIERRGGRIKKQVQIADVIETKVKISPHQLMVKTSNSKMTIQIVPSLKEAVQTNSV